MTTSSSIFDRMAMIQQQLNRRQPGTAEDQPELVPCTTDESAWDGNNNNGLLVDNETKPTGSSSTSEDEAGDNKHNQEVIDYLLRYEEMVLKQDAEEMATLAYIRPLLERLQALGRKQNTPRNRNSARDAAPETTTCLGNDKEDGKTTMHADLCKREITFGEMKRALAILESEDCFLKNAEAEVMTKDRQLMMILRMLTQKISSADDEQGASISWAELVHCYRVCIIGLLTLKDLPKLSSVRSRAKERILSQLSLFEAPEKKIRDASQSSFKTSTVERMSFIDKQVTNGKNSGASDRKSELTLLATVSGLCFAVILGFIIGLSYNSGSSSPYPGNTIKFSGAPSTPPLRLIDSGCNVATTVGNVGNATRTVSSSRIVATTRKQSLPVLPSAIPQRSPQQMDLHKLSAATLVGIASFVNKTANTRQQATPQTKISNATRTELQRLPHEQLLVSAGIGGAVGVLATPQIISLGKLIAGALSLGSLGLLPGTLVVVGAVAASSTVAKGVRYIVDKYLRKSNK